ncbi:stress responsive A/B barrel domain protein [Ruminiclostridium hungatei]|uniref:Stress responsive A/B barrel domain protein n=1 Tax=Ruminiclostridium hungatei TaxID=48256 RepID=A0A1V4SI01_RUMHU|nr:Dabb family protein [Ruminiclostridium hungatei]OPX43095.1 stress responsive A/B barrel domain protein [Ruminiclostridium hungatei]
MLTHVVFFKLKDKSKETLDKVKKDLLALKDQIPLIRSIEVGIDILHAERSFDVVLYSKFDSLEDMKSYQVHPAHVKFGEYINTVKETIYAVDFED